MLSKDGIAIVDENCVNCHQCISACPIKYCNDGSGDHIAIDSELCVQCGSCIKVCTHKARVIVDDFESAMMSCLEGNKTIAIVAPSVAATFGDDHLRVNGWLYEQGASAIFDVSFGAELTIKSYHEHIAQSETECVIAQPCPVLVNYIQLYKPELIQYLAPADSPMVHTIKMIKEFYPQFSGYKIIVISPCIAKAREFSETGIEAFNVTVSSIKKYFNSAQKGLLDYPIKDFTNVSAERAVSFSSPGGLLQTAMRERPDLQAQTRVIEGERVFGYLDTLHDHILEGNAPKLIDCLNCELGCNGGTGTLNFGKAHRDTLESHIEKRKQSVIESYTNEHDCIDAESKVKDVVNNYWKKDLYTRSYRDRSVEVHNIKDPTTEQLESIFHSMLKYEVEDIKNCSSCGYNSCEGMAKAIYNKLNRPENCHFFLQKQAASEIFDSVDTGVMLIDPYSHEIVQANNAALQMVNRSREEVEGKLCHNFVCPAEKGNCPISDHGQSFDRRERTLVTADGITKSILKSVRWVRISGRDMLLESFVDITERKEVEQELRHEKEKLEVSQTQLQKYVSELQAAQDQLIQAEKMASLGALVAGVAHEINTPVGMALTGVTHVDSEAKKIRKEYQTDDMTEERFLSFLDSSEDLNRSVILNLKKAADLIRSFKQVSVDQSSELSRTFNVKSFIEEIVTSLRSTIRKMKITITIEVDSELHITSIAGVYSQILTNLIMNSLLHGFDSEKEGVITIGAKIVHGSLNMSYSDDGHGMDKSIKAKMFDPFFTTRRNAGGSGLGMNIVFNLVTQKLKGSIRCESGLGDGVLFAIKIPLEEKKIYQSIQKLEVGNIEKV
ncbi:MAG: ATP-binding protein [Reichenbachiella sp.]